MRRPTPPSPWAVLFMTLAAVGILGVLLVGYVKERDRQICGVVVLIDDRNQEMPPATDPATAEFRRELHAYRVGLGC